MFMEFSAIGEGNINLKLHPFIECNVIILNDAGVDSFSEIAQGVGI